MCPEKVQSVDDFVPDDGLDRSFLEESIPPKARVAPPPSASAPVDSDRYGALRTSLLKLTNQSNIVVIKISPPLICLCIYYFSSETCFDLFVNACREPAHYQM